MYQLQKNFTFLNLMKILFYKKKQNLLMQKIERRYLTKVLKTTKMFLFLMMGFKIKVFLMI